MWLKPCRCPICCRMLWANREGGVEGRGKRKPGRLVRFRIVRRGENFSFTRRGVVDQHDGSSHGKLPDGHCLQEDLRCYRNANLAEPPNSMRRRAVQFRRWSRPGCRKAWHSATSSYSGSGHEDLGNAGKTTSQTICNGIPKLLCICILTGCHMHTADVF